MNGVSAFLVLISPIVVAVIVYILSGTDTAYGVMEDYLDKSMLALFAIQAFIMMVLMFRVYDRLANHAMRDEQWMSNLIGVCRSKGADTSGMAACYESVVRDESFRMRPFSLVMLIIMAIFTGWTIIDAVARVDEVLGFDSIYTFTPFGMASITVNVVHLVIIVDQVLLIMMAMFVFVPSFLFPYRHEARQIEFTEAMASALTGIGIRTEPMSHSVPPTDPGRLTLITFLTLGYAYFFLMFKSFRYLNEHLMNQWEYESELLIALESGGRHGFRHHVSHEVPKEEGGWFSRATRWVSENLMPRVGRDDRMPVVMAITELFLLFLLGNYYLKLVSLGCMMSDEIHMYNYTIDSLPHLPMHGWHNLILVFMDLYFIVLMVDSILGIASRKAPSWRKVVRCCFTVVIPLWFSAFVTRVTGISHLFDFNVYITTAVLYDLLLLMLVSDRIKRYYTPRGYEMPGIRSWIRYAIWGDIFTFVVDGKYAYPESAYEDETISEINSTSMSPDAPSSVPGPDDLRPPD